MLQLIECSLRWFCRKQSLTSSLKHWMDQTVQLSILKYTGNCRNQRRTNLQIVLIKVVVTSINTFLISCQLLSDKNVFIYYFAFRPVYVEQYYTWRTCLRSNGLCTVITSEEVRTCKFLLSKLQSDRSNQSVTAVSHVYWTDNTACGQQLHWSKIWPHSSSAW